MQQIKMSVFEGQGKKSVTGLSMELLGMLATEGDISKGMYSIYENIVNAPTADDYMNILENNLRAGQGVIRDGTLSANKIGGYDEKGIPFLYLVTIAYLCNPLVSRREKVKLLKEKVQDDYTRVFLRKFCMLGMGSHYLSRAFSLDQEQELKDMITLISAIVNEEQSPIPRH